MDAWALRVDSIGNQRLSDDGRRKLPELSSSSSSSSSNGSVSSQEEDSPQSDGDDAHEKKERVRSAFAAMRTRKEDDNAHDDEQDRDDERVAALEQDSLETRYEQLRQDMDVLVAHLEKQTQDMDTERAAMASARLQQQHALDAMARELESLRVERDALRAQNEHLTQRNSELAAREAAACEAHEELLVALKSQQQRDEQSRTLVMHFIKERDALRKQLDESKAYSRRVEEELVTTRADTQQLQAEHAALTARLRAASASHGERESRREQEQARLIESLRADLVQMEFELKTLSVDRDKLTQRVASLQRQQVPRSSYEVISLSSNAAKQDKAPRSKRLTVVTATPAPGSSKNSSSNNNKDTFTNLMTLPNRVDDGSSDAQAVVTRTASHRRSPVGSLVSKTISSARKRLFQSSNKTTTTVLPQ
ncbi:hypothetical protein PINS_up007154 [Pythium insidiosum]|nr:hypothetical protein PINS_up007154 [Pythium insidiosum]